MLRLHTNNLSRVSLPALLLYASKCLNLFYLFHLPKYTIVINYNVPTISITSLNIFKHYKNKSYTHVLIHYNLTNSSNLLPYYPIKNLPDLPRNLWKDPPTTLLLNLHLNEPIAAGTLRQDSNHYLREDTITTNDFVQTPLQSTIVPSIELLNIQPFQSHHKQDSPLQSMERGCAAKTSPPHTTAHDTDDVKPQIQIFRLSHLPKRMIAHSRTQAIHDQPDPKTASKMHSCSYKCFDICKHDKRRDINKMQYRDKQERRGGISITLTPIKNEPQVPVTETVIILIIEKVKREFIVLSHKIPNPISMNTTLRVNTKYTPKQRTMGKIIIWGGSKSKPTITPTKKTNRISNRFFTPLPNLLLLSLARRFLQHDRSTFYQTLWILSIYTEFPPSQQHHLYRCQLRIGLCCHTTGHYYYSYASSQEYPPHKHATNARGHFPPLPIRSLASKNLAQKYPQLEPIAKASSRQGPPHDNTTARETSGHLSKYIHLTNSWTQSSLPRRLCVNKRLTPSYYPLFLHDQLLHLHSNRSAMIENIYAMLGMVLLNHYVIFIFIN
jgi:hypothetical protein